MKKMKKLKLAKDTLIHLEADSERAVRGGESNPAATCWGSCTITWENVSSCAIPCPEW